MIYGPTYLTSFFDQLMWQTCINLLPHLLGLEKFVHVSALYHSVRNYRIMRTNTFLLLGHLSEKSDVYRFGVVLLEIMAGRWATNAIRPGIEEISLNWARNNLERKLKKAMDPRLGDDYPLKGAFQYALLVRKCIEISPQWRPSMKEVLETLEDINTVKITKAK